MLPSPCINICRMDAASGLCLGCFRNIDEITRWAHADEASQRAILTAIEQRRQNSVTPEQIEARHG